MEESAQSEELEQIEIQLLLEGIYRHYGYDFREYAPASLRRRIWNVIQAEKLKTVSGLQERLLHDPACMEQFLLALSVNVTAMFRDPEFYRVFRKKVVPLLRTYPSIKIWHAGCSTGEEVYSMAIVLEEEGLLDRCTIYATDINEAVLKKARAGIFPLENMKEYTANYLQAGGTHSFSEYYTAGYGSAILRPPLGKNIVLAQHNLVTDGPFNQFHVIWCRNVTIYFNKTLQRRVHRLLYESLITFGVLGLGSKETLKSSPYEEKFETLGSGLPLYRKIG
jgi:chemotaxis protein methyltransferase CheR